jgi:hypothetical protein
MPITAQQARAELARRELVRRGVSLEEQPQKSPGAMVSFLKGVYEGAPKINVPENIRLREIPGLETDRAFQDIQNFYANQKPQGFGEKVAQGLGQIVPMLPSAGAIGRGISGATKAASPLLNKLPFLGKAIQSGIGQSALTGATYGGTKAALEGKPTSLEALSSAAQFALWHLGGKLGASLPIPKRIGSALGAGGVGYLTAPEGEREVGGILGAGMGAAMPSRPFSMRQAEPIDLFSKAIRPSSKGKETKTSRDYYYNSALTAMKEIIKNKGNLEEGKLPENLVDFSKAIDSTKKVFYEEYKGLEELAGVKTRIPVSEITTMLKNEFINKKSVLPQQKQAALEMIDYIKQMYSLKGFANLEDITGGIQQINEVLQSKPQDAAFLGKAKPMTRTVEMLREAVDKSIEQKTGGQWEQIRKKYAAMKQIETDVNKAVIREAKKANPSVVHSLMSTVADSNIVAGMISMNPALIGKGFAMKTIFGAVSKFNDPNYQVGRMFRTLEKQQTIVPESIPKNIWDIINKPTKLSTPRKE